VKNTSSPVLDVYHYPPELFEVLVEAIPALCKSKQAVLDFFRGAGTPLALLRTWQTQVQSDRDAVKKADIARDVLRALNEGGDALIAPRREVIKRVSEFEDFSSCWHNDRMRAEVSVYKVREIVNRKDSFTRMNIERERERKLRQDAHKALMAERHKRASDREAIKKDLYALFAEKNAWRRGKALEGVLNRLFASYEILVKEAFTVKGDPGQGIVEQIDGAVEVDGHLYLVEVKWWEQRIGRAELAPHLVSVYSRADARGMFISCSGFSEGALNDAKMALSQRIYLLAELEEIVHILDQEKDMKHWIAEKAMAAQTNRQPLFKS
jgi:restriction system protein